MPNTKLRKNLLCEIKDILAKYRSHKDKINMKDRWSGQMTREDKLMEAIDLIMERNNKQKDRNDIESELKVNLSN